MIETYTLSYGKSPPEASYYPAVPSFQKGFPRAVEKQSLSFKKTKPVYVEKGKMKILTKEMETDVFYIVSYKGDKYAVRKLDEDRVEFREVIE